MCGIAFVLTGAELHSSCLPNTSSFQCTSPREERLANCSFYPRINDLKEVICRRGPDHMGQELLHLKLADSTCEQESQNIVKMEKRLIGVLSMDEANDHSLFSSKNTIASMLFLASTLQLRGITPTFQPLRDSHSNILVYNGEIFGGIFVGDEQCDTTVLMDALESCCSCLCHASETNCCCSDKEGHISVPQLLSRIKGPWSLVYWQETSRILWFGRDAFGRRSLVVHWPSVGDSRFILSSIGPSEMPNKTCPEWNGKMFTKKYDERTRDGDWDVLEYWNELECGIYSISLETRKVRGAELTLVGIVNKHSWSNDFLKQLLDWERFQVMPKHLSDIADPGNSCCRNEPDCDCNLSTVSLQGPESKISASDVLKNGRMPSALKVLYALRESVIRRACQKICNKGTEGVSTANHTANTAILFSGGVDSMILAALLDQALDSHSVIDLLNISFDGPFAPDRVSAKAGLAELKKIAPFRRWRLVEIDADPSNIQQETSYLTSIIFPAKTYMDLNIGTALWLAARGDGWVEEEDISSTSDEPLTEGKEKQMIRQRYTSEAKVLLVGSGADEQCAGYGRHRTKYKEGGWHALQEELKIDFQRIWKRNLGRDDRCIADNGKEARFPFLDEDVVYTLLDLPLWEIANLEKPAGEGDKKILRQVACLLGLTKASTTPKRAIQFGSRIARESNRRHFGSNRAANQASAGNVMIHFFADQIL